MNGIVVRTTAVTIIVSFFLLVQFFGFSNIFASILDSISISNARSSDSSGSSMITSSSSASSNTNNSYSLEELQLKGSPLSVRYHRRAIAALVTNQTNDIQSLCYGLSSLKHLPDHFSTNPNNNLQNYNVDSHSIQADMIVFHENLSSNQKQYLMDCIADDSSTSNSSGSRRIRFATVGYSFTEDFPIGFNATSETPNLSKRSKWGYQQMIRFWITKIWDHPMIQQYDTVMRLDSDSCYLLPIHEERHQHIPGLPNPQHNDSNSSHRDDVVYHSARVFLDRLDVSQGFGVFVHDYVKRNGLVVQNPKLFSEIPTEWNTSAPLFFNNFEISSVAFMRRSEVSKFHTAITEQEPFGVFRYRWGDALERYATIAIFATNNMLVRGLPDGYKHKKAAADCKMFDKTLNITSSIAHTSAN